MRIRAWRTWLPVSLMAILCALLAVVQYRWIGEISVAEHERMKTGLGASLRRLARDFNYDISSSLFALLPPGEPDHDEESPEQLFDDAYVEWLESGRSPKLFSRLAIVILESGKPPVFRLLNAETKSYQVASWPKDWYWLEQAVGPAGRGFRPGPAGPEGHGPGGPPFAMFFGRSDGSVLLTPRFLRPMLPPVGEAPARPRNRQWLIAEIDKNYVGNNILRDLMSQHLGPGQYDAEITTRSDQRGAIFRTSQSVQPADGAISILELTPEAFFQRFAVQRRSAVPSPVRRTGREGARGSFGPPGLGEGPMRGRWLLSVRHKGGSLDAIIARARWRNLGLSAFVLLLLMAAATALIRYSRQAEKLAAMQMEFVAGISHELRTPLTVIRMAAFNLKGRIAQNPSQVERYGTLIAQESDRLTAIVEQVLRFASLDSGKAAAIPQTPVEINDLLAHTLESCRPVIEHAHCEVERKIAPKLPAVLGDSIALQHALQNLITNAIKYGTESSNWIGVSAEEIQDGKGLSHVEIRVADRGPGIPEEEQAHLFDPFFRGRRAMEDQIHGTGLGLNLVKKIIEAHGGRVSVKSAAGQGTEFMVRIPVAPAEYQDEFAHTFG